jgi:two-component system, cell cycle sensor histidine kinase and response regulator CckA
MSETGRIDDNLHYVSLEREVSYLKARLSDSKRDHDIISKWELFFNVLIDNFPDILYFKDLHSRFTLINQAQANVLGVEKPDDAYGKTDFDFFTEHHAQSAYEDERRIIKSGKPLINKRERIRIADGSFQWVLATKIPIIDDDGKITGIAGISRDISEQVAAEQDIRQSEQKFRSVWENSLDGMWLVDSNGTIISVNHAFCKMVRKNPAELIGKHFSSVYAPSERYAIMQRWSQGFTSRKIQPHMEDEFVLWNNRKIWFEVSNSYIDSGGQRLLVLSIFRDITDRKEMIRQLKMFEHSIRSVNDSINITDLNENIIFVNRAFCELYGYSVDEIIGEKVTTLLSESNEPGAIEPILPETLDGGWKGEVLCKKRTGEDIQVSLSKSIIRNETDDPIAVISVANDISARKRLEAQALQAQKLEGIGVLVGGIAHHFNNILNIIVGYTSLLDQDNVDLEKLKKSTQNISDAAERGTDLVQHLMTFVKKSPMRPERVSANDILKKTIDLARETFPDTISFETALASEHDTIEADPNHFRQGVLNIFLNSRDAMPDGGTITVKSFLKDHADMLESFSDVKNSEYLCIEISDTGIGMKEEVRSRVFEPFFTTKDFGKGVGMGLPMVYGMVDSHKGLIEVASKYGVGSTFRLYFPVLQTSAA